MTEGTQWVTEVRRPSSPAATTPASSPAAASHAAHPPAAASHAAATLPYLAASPAAPPYLALSLAWTSHVDPVSGCTFYYHGATNRSQWELPVCPSACAGDELAIMSWPWLHGTRNYSDDFIYAQMLQYINVHGMGWSRARWESIFGQVAQGQPFGARFWSGFPEYLHGVYLPRSRGMVSGYMRSEFTPMLFELPDPFSQHLAKLPKCTQNPGHAEPQRYPCMVPTCELTRQEDWLTMICINILVNGSRAWMVHSTWLTRLHV